MATVRISQLTAITAPTDDDVLIINDADTNTRKITFANLTQNLVNTTSATQTKSGALTVSGTLTAGANFVVDTNTFFVDSVTNRVGIKTISPNNELDVDGTVHIRNSNTLQFGDANDSNYVSLGAPSVIASNFALTLPAALPAANNLLWSDGSGNLGFTTGVTYDSGTQAMTLGQAYFTNQGSVRFYEQSVNGSEYIGFTAPANLASTSGYTLPGTYPVANGYVLASSTGGVLTWVSNGAGAAGVAGDVQFSDGSQLTSNSNFTFNNGTQTLTVPSISCGTYFEANGNIQLGNGSGDDISFNGSLTTDFRPKTTGAVDLGSSVLHFAEAHVDDLYVYGNTEVGNGAGDLLSVNAAIDTALLPDVTVTRDIGSTIVRWGSIFGNNIDLTGDATLGDTAGDLCTINADIAGRLIPRNDNTVNLGDATHRFNNAHVNQFFTYGTTTLGNDPSDAITISGVITSDLVPGVGFFRVGTGAAPFAEVNATEAFIDLLEVNTSSTLNTEIIRDARASHITRQVNALASAGTSDVILGFEGTYGSFKLLIQATDDVTGDRHFIEHYITQDGNGGLNEITPVDIESTPGTTLITVAGGFTPSGGGSGDDVIVTITNTAVSTNAVTVKLDIERITA